MKVRLEMTTEELTALRLCKNLLECHADDSKLAQKTVAEVREILERADFIHDN